MILQKEEKHNSQDLSSNNNPPRGSTGEKRTSLEEYRMPVEELGVPLALEEDREKAFHDFQRMVQEEQDSFPYYDPRVFTDKESREAYKLVAEKTAPLVTRGPLNPNEVTPLPQKTKIDTLSFTAEEPFFIMKELLVLSCKEENLKFLPRKNGINGYTRGYDIVLNGQSLGVLSYGSGFNEAQASRPQIYIEGSGKTDKFDFFKFYQYSKLLLEGRIKRIDIALDTFKKEFSIESAIEAHIDMKFKAPNAPKNPKITPYGQIQPDGSNPGRTVYIGSLQSSKFVRFYEKGYEYYKNEIAKENADTPRVLGIQKLFETGDPTTVEDFNNGEPFDIRNWIRAEVEFKDGNCVLPLEMLINTDSFFSGSYQYLGEILNMCNGEKPKRLMTEMEMDLDIRKKNIKAIAGSLIDDLLYLGYSPEQIIQELKGGKGPSQKLIKSGLVKQ